HSIIEQKERELLDLSQSFLIAEFNNQLFEEPHKEEMKRVSQTVNDKFIEIKTTLDKLITKIRKTKSDFETSIKYSKWKESEECIQEELNTTKEQLLKVGLDTMNTFEMMHKEEEELEAELLNIESQSIFLETDKKIKDKLLSDYTQLTKNISTKRKNFVKTINGEKLKVNIRQFRNATEFENRIRKILQKEAPTFQSDIDKLISFIFN